ncbi:MAG: hypothetical protein ACSHX7_11575 [Luteolibacter sp.]
MLRLRFIHNLKSIIWIVLVAFIPLSAYGLYWANKTGLPAEWRDTLEQEISKHGAHVEIGSLTYIPLQGFVARNVRIFAEEERENEISRLERVQLVFDNTRLARGEFKISKVQLRNARLSLPVDTMNPAGESLHFSNIYGTILMSGKRRIEARDTRAKVGGINVTLNARLLTKAYEGHDPDYDKNEGRKREFVANIINELQHWNFDEDLPPEVYVDLTGDLSDRETIKSDFRIEAPSLEKKQYSLKEFKASGTLDSDLLTINSFSAIDGRGSLDGHADYHLEAREGRFDIDSSIDIPRLLKSWLSTPLKLEFLIGGKQQIHAAGTFDLNDLKAPVIQATGHAVCDSALFRGISFDSMETWFSYQNGDLFLRDLVFHHPDGTAKGKALIKGKKVMLSLHSTLPPSLYKPLFKGKPLEEIIPAFTENDNPEIDITLEGSFMIGDRFSWQYSGSGFLKNYSYKGVPVKFATCSFDLDHKALDFHDGTVTFDYSDYKMRKDFNGPNESTTKVGRIRYEGEDTKLVRVEGVEGVFWAAPMVRFFAPDIADNLEQYRFHRPPNLSGSGVVDVTPQGRTNLTVKFSSPASADYEFLGENLTLTNPSATVSIKNKNVRVSGLSVEAFGGDVSGSFKNSGSSELTGEIKWSKVGIPGLSSTYDFDMKGGGDITGRLEFSLLNGDINSMNGKGLVALEDGELFSVPIFGPLSTPMSAVLGKKRAGFQSAKAAFCTFTIRNGVFRTRDFQTRTSSIQFTGDGSVGLSDKELDFTIRLNARGLLGIITLPLRPFAGLFQFRGTGQLKDAEWKNVGFTSPPKEQNEILLTPPPKATIVEE